MSETLEEELTSKNLPSLPSMGRVACAQRMTGGVRAPPWG
jgi:hypothetical protein